MALSMGGRTRLPAPVDTSPSHATVVSVCTTGGWNEARLLSCGAVSRLRKEAERVCKEESSDCRRQDSGVSSTAPVTCEKRVERRAHPGRPVPR